MSRAAAKNSGRIFSCASLNVAFWISTTSSAVRAGSIGRMRLSPLSRARIGGSAGPGMEDAAQTMKRRDGVIASGREENHEFVETPAA
jgi:hypothetical protein